MIRPEDLLQDARHALRVLRRSPLFAIAAVLCLVVGIATNTAIFSVFDAIVLRPLPFTHPERLVTLSQRDPITGRRAALSYAEYRDLRRDARSFAQMGVYAGRRVALTQGQEPGLVRGQLVSASLFPMLGVSPRIGRPLQADDDRIGAAPVVLLSDAVWRLYFAADPAIVGRVIAIDHQPYTVVGVMPPGFKFPEMSELWMPIGPALGGPRHAVSPVSVIARLAPGWSLAQASAEVAALVRSFNRRYAPAAAPREDLLTGAVRPLAGGFMGSDDRIVAGAMLGATICLLLIACANVGNLLLTRAIGRQREFAVRTALGSSRGRLTAQMVTEGVILAGVACAVALPLAGEALRWIRAAVPSSDPYPYYVHWALDAGTFLYAAIASLLTGVAFGVGPAWHVARGRLSDALKEGTHGAGTGGRSGRAQRTLVVAEVGLALVALVGAALFARTFVGLRRTNLGYDPARIMTMRFFLPGARYDAAVARDRFVQDVLPAVAAVPGVTAVTVSDLIPLDDEGGSEGPVVIAGRPEASARGATIAYSGVAGDWFRTFAVPILAGHAFTAPELRDSLPVAVIDRTMAQRFWPQASPIGRRFRLAGDSARTWFTVVGVAADIRTTKLDENRSNPPEAYLPYRFVPTRDYGLMVRTPLDPQAVTAGVRQAIHAVDGTVPVFNVWTMDEVRYLSFWMYAMWGTMFAIFGGIALLLAAVGVYAVIFYGTVQRTHELGVRMALGAARRDIVRLVLRQGLLLAGIGAGLGLLVALVLTRVVQSLLIGVSATDPVSFGAVVTLLLGVAALASYIPARRATGVDPLIALRAE